MHRGEILVKAKWNAFNLFGELNLSGMEGPEMYLFQESYVYRNPENPSTSFQSTWKNVGGQDTLTHSTPLSHRWWFSNALLQENKQPNAFKAEFTRRHGR